MTVTVIAWLRRGWARWLYWLDEPGQRGSMVWWPPELPRPEGERR